MKMKTGFMVKTNRVRLPLLPRANLLPGCRTSLEVPECLRQFQWLNHNALLLLVVSNLGVSRKWEVLSQRVSIKAIVRHDSSQVWVIDEEDTKQIIDLALVPVGTIVEGGNRGDRRGLVGVCLDPDAGIVSDGQEIINDFEASIAGWVVDGGDVADLGELGGGVVLEKGEGGDDTGGRDVDDELVLPYRESVTVSALKFSSTLILRSPLTAGCIWADTRAGTGRIGGGCRLSLGICLHGSVSRALSILIASYPYPSDSQWAHAICPAALAERVACWGYRRCRRRHPCGGRRTSRRLVRRRETGSGAMHSPQTAAAGQWIVSRPWRACAMADNTRFP